MASALEERIDLLSFLASSGASLPSAFREHADVTPILREFCERVMPEERAFSHYARRNTLLCVIPLPPWSQTGSREHRRLLLAHGSL